MLENCKRNLQGPTMAQQQLRLPDNFLLPQLDQRHSPLTALPLEIRIKILEMLLNPGDSGLDYLRGNRLNCTLCEENASVWVEAEKVDSLSNTSLASSILASCQQIFREGFPIMYEQSELIIYAQVSMWNETVTTFNDHVHWTNRPVSRQIPAGIWKYWKHFTLNIRFTTSEAEMNEWVLTEPALRHTWFLNEIFDDLKDWLPKEAHLTVCCSIRDDSAPEYRKAVLDRAMSFTKLLRCRKVTITGLPPKQALEIERVVTSHGPVYNLYRAAAAIDSFIDYPGKQLLASPTSDWDNITRSNLQKMWDAVWRWDLEGFVTTRAALLKRMQMAMSSLVAPMNEAFGLHSCVWDEAERNAKEQKISPDVFFANDVSDSWNLSELCMADDE